MERRDFIKSGLTGSAAISLATLLSCTGDAGTKSIPKRQLGRTGEMLSAIGFGGILVMDEEQNNANSAVAQAVDRGINYFDVAPSYGNAELKLGPALEPFRKNAFLACKTNKRDRAGAQEELDQSLKNMRTDHFDLYQLHALSSIEDVEQVFGPDGAMEVFHKAQRDGKIRYVGFSAHSEEAALLAMEKYDFDTILMPINYATWLQGNFAHKAVAKAKERNMGILALKGLAGGRIQEGDEKMYDKCWYHPISIEDDQLADIALRFTFAQGVTAAIPPGEPLFFPRALDIASNITPLSDKEMDMLAQAAKQVEPLFRTA